MTFAGSKTASKSVTVSSLANSDDEEYTNDADDESKDVSDEDDGDDTEVGEDNSRSSRSKRKLLNNRRKQKGKSKLRRKHLESFADHNFETTSREVHTCACCLTVSRSDNK